MSLSTGTRLGPYEIVELLGVGGMGEVYRAYDPRLRRDVAVKVILSAGEPGQERLRRFEEEARAVAALSHPNVLTVFDVGTDEGRPYVVFELLDGETLRDTLRRGALPLRRAVELTVQACHGLEAAHARGLVHRDLKPANLFLTADGWVKILDFGLAKLTRGDEGVAPGEGSRTATAPGAILGTTAYLSPEQVRGLPADARADLFALGVVLYEMLSGRRPFSGDTPADVLAAILHQDPPPLRTRTGPVPLAVDRIVGRCLEKQAEDRFHSAHDVALALEAVREQLGPGLPRAGEPEERSPYPGLCSFTEEDAGRFFGRETEAEALWSKLPGRRLLAVIGPSGAGKTSFVRAGVVASRPSGWGALVCTPGAQPFRSLGEVVAPELSGDPEALRKLVRFDELETAFELMGRWRNRHTEALLVVDQFEELFTLAPAELQERFAAFLGRLAGEADVHVLLSVRDDFLMRCSEHEALARVFTELTPLPALSGEGLRRALLEPARGEGYRFEDEALVDEMLAAVEGARGALPLLAFAISRLWERRDREGQVLTRKAYEEIGGVAGALAHHAEATLDRIGGERQGIVREVFRNLVTAQGTRASCEREELLSAFPERLVAELVLEELIAARLLTSYERPAGEGAEEKGRHRIEVVHESLLKAWPRLVWWQAQDEEGAQLRDQLRQAAHLWEEKGRSPDVLWSGTAYREFELWRERYPGGLTAIEEEFAHAMSTQMLRRKRRRRLAVAAAFAALAAVAGAIAVSQRQAVRSARLAVASKLVALGRLELDRYPTATVAYARKSLEIADTFEARRLALEALWHGPVARFLALREDEAGCVNVTASPDGRWLACVGFGEDVLLFSRDGSGPRALSLGETTASWRHIEFSPDGELLAAGVPLHIWSLDRRDVTPPDMPQSHWWFTDDRKLAFLHRPPPGEGGEYVIESWPLPKGEPRVMARWELAVPVSNYAVDRQLRWWVYVRDRSLYLRRLDQGSDTGRDILMGTHPTRVWDVNPFPEVDRFVSFDDEEIRIWSGSTGELLRVLPSTGHPGGLDGTASRLAGKSSEEQAVYVKDLEGPPDAQPLFLRRHGVGPGMGTLAFVDRDRWLAHASEDGVSFWAVGQPWPRVLRGHRPAVSRLAFTTDGRWLASCAGDGVRLWPLSPEGGTWRAVHEGDFFQCWGLATEPSGRHVLMVGPPGAVLAPVDGGPARTLARNPNSPTIGGALDADGRWAIVGTNYSVEPDDRLLYVVDRRTGETREYPLPGANASDGYTGGVTEVRFTGDGRFLTAGPKAPLLWWDPETGAHEELYGGPGVWCPSIDTSADGHTLVAVCDAASETEAHRRELLVFDLETGARRAIVAHGERVSSVAIDARGRVLATGDETGAVRVGPVTGEEPHLLLGDGPRPAVALSPDGRWVASAGGTEIRLWPMPDLTRPPLHSLPHDALLATLHALTNLRVVEDATAPTGFDLDLGPFPGWDDAPTW